MALLQCCREAAEKYPDIQYEEVIIDNACMMVSTCIATIEKNLFMIFEYLVAKLVFVVNQRCVSYKRMFVH